MPTYAIRYRRDTTANWLAANPILLDGEMGYERTEDGRLLCKMGDGVCGADGTVTGTHWVDLPYVSGPAGPSPEFEWAGTSLRFKNPDGTWGEWTDLQGAQGLQGVQGIPGPTGVSVPATRTTLGGILVGNGLDINADGCLQTRTDGVTVTEEGGVLSALGGSLLLNAEAWITESGTWTAPVEGWYEVLVINAGWGGHLRNGYAYGDRSGATRRAFIYLHAGEEVDVTIGAGGSTTFGAHMGGKSSFGDVEPEYDSNGFAGVTIFGTGTNSYGLGGGPGGSPTWTEPPTWYGGGGGGNKEGSNAAVLFPGYQGAVHVCWHDPAKAAGPLPAPALLSGRRMAARAAAAPATVNLFDPETGQGSVWREEDVEAKLAEGLITEEAWLAICAQKAAEDYAAWLADPETEAERFALLRATRDAKLAEHDVQVVQLQRQARAGADVADELAAWDAYAVALCDLPEQPGAPWDGGGELTPWPAEPEMSANEEA